ncbi:MarR family winged helix-turn-helix transcriptional regulator [Hymenobacter guriensis]|uniref:Winged helix-turn-helix transcriptional regulator n=1 Tax=Hymenobacter guriensis TaxID=2793065 RepID=A0ABS0L6X0_9BACT|nr:MarR family winged helix-turn-helix transcriptional regulator [Hymenobacter guriensis]MBG8555852.1 winged helix-turn-helix transcriptional regulator [Hymenobacter guriensis]
MNYAFFRQLLNLAETFEAQHPAAGQPDAMAAFASWLHARTAPAPDTAPVTRSAAKPGEFDESVIGKLITFMYRYARSYLRLALAGSPLITSDDFTYLVTVYGHQPISKTEVIERNIHEKPTGTEIIKRLLKQGFIAEQGHQTDRRRKLLTLTESGREVLFGLFGRMSQVAYMIAGNLEPAERRQLLYLLLKLDHFHHAIFAHDRSRTFEELLRSRFPDLPAAGHPPGQ